MIRDLLPTIEIGSNRKSKSKVSLFFTSLLELFIISSQSYLYLELFILGLIVGLAIRRVEFIGKDITIGLFTYFY